MTKYLNSDGLAHFLEKLKPLIDAKADLNHTHKYAGSSTAGGAANSVANSFSIQLNGGTATSFNGSAAKNINITASSIGINSTGDISKVTNCHYSEENGEASWRYKYVSGAALAWWNGAYNGTASNLTYCNKGAFGTIVTKNQGDYLSSSGGVVTGLINATTSDSTDIGITARNNGTGKAISFVIGASGNNRGVYDATKGVWMLYADANDDVWMNGTASIASKVKNSLSVTMGSTTTTYDGSSAKSINVSLANMGVSVTTEPTTGSSTYYSDTSGKSWRYKLVNGGALSWWNGAFNNTASNLQYCNKGAFGTGAVRNISGNISVGTSAPSGTATNGDIYIQYT